jgi:hypothetical protein
MNDHTADPTGDALARYIVELVDLVGPLAATLDHMQESRDAGRSAPAGPPPVEVLATLLRGILDDVAYRHGPASLNAAAILLRDTCRTFCEELMLLPIGQEPPCVPGRRRSRGR